MYLELSKKTNVTLHIDYLNSWSHFNGTCQKWQRRSRLWHIYNSTWERTSLAMHPITNHGPQNIERSPNDQWGRISQPWWLADGLESCNFIWTFSKGGRTFSRPIHLNLFAKWYSLKSYQLQNHNVYIITQFAKYRLLTHFRVFNLVGAKAVKVRQVCGVPTEFLS